MRTGVQVLCKMGPKRAAASAASASSTSPFLRHLYGDQS
jgi:hypothetical protein